MTVPALVWFRCGTTICPPWRTTTPPPPSLSSLRTDVISSAARRARQVIACDAGRLKGNHRAVVNLYDSLDPLPVRVVRGGLQTEWHFTRSLACGALLPCLNSQ